MEQNKEKIYYVNGQFVPESEAKISVLDRAFLYGDALFEGIRVRNKIPFKLHEHLVRIFKGMAYLQIESPLTLEEMKNVIMEVIKRNDIVDGYIRPQISRGEGLAAFIWEPEKLVRKPNFVVIPARAVLTKAVQEGARAKVVSTRRIPPSCISSAAKTCNYVNNIVLPWSRPLLEQRYRLCSIWQQMLRKARDTTYPLSKTAFSVPLQRRTFY